MLIGVTGESCAGKDTTARCLNERGYIHYSLSDQLRAELGKKRRFSDLGKLANELRKKHGPGFLAERALETFEPEGDYVISSIRNPAEAEILKTRGDFYLVSVTAPQKVRFKRMLERGREKNEPKTFEEFLKEEARQKKGADYSQNIGRCIKAAEFQISNRESAVNPMIVLRPKVYDLLQQIKNKIRPSWDERFMRVLEGIEAMSTCDRGSSGALIVKDKRILATGYSGSPAGLKHCTEVGHLFEKRLNPDGTISMHCVRTTHAEENAIAQAAKYGPTIMGATIYCTMEPCSNRCAPLIINAGIKRVVARYRYHGAELTRKWFRGAKIELVVLNEEVKKYAKQN